MRLPVRYRGHYYDTETGFYYLNSRYYDPAVRRFINAEGLVSTGQGVSGYNMYAYCTNDPVNSVDPSGCAGKAGGPVSKAFIMIAPLISLIKDVVNFNLKNTSEKKVLDSTYFSAYKNTLVFRIPGFEDRSFSFGMMFISPRSDSNQEESIRLVKHEYGHTDAFRRLGPFFYLLFVGIPSMTSSVRGTDYYKQPWEAAAESYGNVGRPDVTSEDLQRGDDYISCVEKLEKVLLSVLVLRGF